MEKWHRAISVPPSSLCDILFYSYQIGSPQDRRNRSTLLVSSSLEASEAIAMRSSRRRGFATSDFSPRRDATSYLRGIAAPRRRSVCDRPLCGVDRLPLCLAESVQRVRGIRPSLSPAHTHAARHFRDHHSRVFVVKAYIGKPPLILYRLVSS